MPSLDVAGSGARTAPEHIAAIAVKVGVTFGFTVMVSVAVVAHCPAPGVKVYVVVAVLFSAGAQVPVMPSLDVVGSGARTAPEHIAATAAKVVVSFGFTVMVSAAFVAHCPALGVKVYVVVAVLFSAGAQVPVMPLSDVVGSGARTAPEHIAATAVKVVVSFGFTVMVSAAFVAHCPALGVKVYVVVAVLFSAGAQVPVMPLSDVVGSGARTAPEHIAATAVKVVVSFGFTVMVSAAFVAHCPALGVKVYVVVAVLFSAGAQVPVMPLSDVVGSGARTAPEHIAATAVKVGVTFGFTVMVSVAVVAHCPAPGVKVYVVVAVLFSAGAQVPVMPLSDVVGSGARTAPEHIAATAAKVGVTFGFTVMVSVAVVAHCPAPGVKVYVVVAVLFSAGAHVPVMPSLDVVGSGARTAPEHIAATAATGGVTFAFTVMVSVAVVAHCPAPGVKVYVVVAVLFSAGAHVPVMPSLDVVGSGG